MVTDSLHWRAWAHVDKFTPGHVQRARELSGAQEPSHAQLLAIGPPEETADSEGNLVTTAGLGIVTNLILGLGAQAATGTATTRLGVGNGVAGSTRADTDLGAAAGSANRWFQPVSSVAQSTISFTNDTMTFVSTFAGPNANFTWNEWGIDISAATVAAGTTVGTTLLNHATSAALGTKTAASAWTLTVTIQLS